jgi:hypothetical protein
MQGISQPELVAQVWDALEFFEEVSAADLRRSALCIRGKRSGCQGFFGNVETRFWFRCLVLLALFIRTWTKHVHLFYDMRRGRWLDTEFLEQARFVTLCLATEGRLFAFGEEKVLLLRRLLIKCWFWFSTATCLLNENVAIAKCICGLKLTRLNVEVACRKFRFGTKHVAYRALRIRILNHGSNLCKQLFCAVGCAPLHAQILRIIPSRWERKLIRRHCLELDFILSRRITVLKNVSLL